MTATFWSNRGGAGGGADRVTTDFETAEAGGRAADAWRDATRIDSFVGTIGIAPRTTGARSTRLMIDWSRT
jgi:hypothetical protein